MLKLREKARVHNASLETPRLVSVTSREDLPTSMRSRYALLIPIDHPPFAAPEGFASILVLGGSEAGEELPVLSDSKNVFLLSEDFQYLAEGDIVRLNPESGNVSTVFRKNTPNNSILLTERCNHLCLMCSQPPKDVDDTWLLEDAFALVRMIPTDTPNIGFTGGEPTTYGNRFIELIEITKRNLPKTSVDVLTNGRAFKSESYAAKLGRVKHPDLQLGIPIYSDDPVRHDFIVQSEGAFDETLHGVLNLKRHGVRVEIRVVIHQQSLPRLVQTCEFIVRNLLFVDHVALMGLEITGFTRANLEQLWIDPYEYRDTLSEAIGVLKAYGLSCSIYNHQLCLINDDVHDVCRQSISDWKNEFLPACDGCSKRQSCGGFFSSQVAFKRSEHIAPYAA
ncbi:His-Xaa-Ser system radical SAM maturase HxsC [Bordetella genomosp. 8]|uniref:His-Xaa-Ser system radical SAM maturase HxsC n=1 Tax=Bordetella genomosp. 8 TaxID=1416806 RepID=A0A1W6YTA1_9BORD|nr:His-Xaa-Ser system radical SAM maturase HxsC [Bordetella genomosp. 8]ARP84320.1 His-Xaa-Ser system radical SAM maturase HxsC [Bordetella genomosp. 8]